MNFFDETLDLFQRGAVEEAYAKVLDRWKKSKNQFMEILDLATASDYIAYSFLYAQLSSQEKKPWKAIPILTEARGALRFLFDFASDRELCAATAYSFAQYYAAAGFLPEAFDMYLASAKEGKNPNFLRDALENAAFFGLRSDKDIVEVETILNDLFGDILCREVLSSVRSEIAAALKLDPVESTEAFLSIRYEVEEAVDEVLKKSPPQGAYHLAYWNAKKEILSSRFGISWSSPKEMNPSVRFQ